MESLDLSLFKEKEFESFNKICTVLCRNDPCKYQNCTFAHNKQELKKSICLLFIDKKCHKRFCNLSHDIKQLEKCIDEYKQWKLKKASPEKSPDIVEKLVIEVDNTELKTLKEKEPENKGKNEKDTPSDLSDDIDKKITNFVEDIYIQNRNLLNNEQLVAEIKNMNTIIYNQQLVLSNMMNIINELNKKISQLCSDNIVNININVSTDT